MEIQIIKFLGVPKYNVASSCQRKASAKFMSRASNIFFFFSAGSTYQPRRKQSPIDNERKAPLAGGIVPSCLCMRHMVNKTAFSLSIRKDTFIVEALLQIRWCVLWAGVPALQTQRAARFHNMLKGCINL